jgi:hypothetical protein
MSYATRPMGDYKTYGYAGDPGFLSSLWKGVKSIALPIIGGMIAGPVGAQIGGALGAPKPKMTPPMFPQPTVGGMPLQAGVSFPGGTQLVVGGTVPTRGPYGYPRAPTAIAAAQAAAGPGGCPTGYHLAKDGSGRWVRNRRMNVANPRALRRSMRRVQGFEKLAKRTIQFTRRVKMKKRRSS